MIACWVIYVDVLNSICKFVPLVGYRDTEDHISWLLQHGWHEKALAAVEAGQGCSELLDEVLCLNSFSLAPLMISHFKTLSCADWFNIVF